MATRTKDQNSYVHGSWNVICDVCGFKFKSCDVKKRWDGLYVCADDWETRHVSDFYKAPKEDTSVPYSRPDSSADSSYTDVGGNSVTTDNSPDIAADADETLTVGSDHPLQLWSTTLTANRTITLDTTGASWGDRFTITRTDGAAYTLDVGGLKTIPASIDATVVVEYNGSAWVLISYTTLGI